MLKFYNSNIYLDLELTRNSKGFILGCDFLPENQLKFYFPEIKRIKNLDVDWLKSTETNLFLTYRQYIYFIYNWYLKSDIHLKSIYSWIKEYFNDIIRYCDKLPEYALEDTMFPNYLEDFLFYYNQNLEEKDLTKKVKNIKFSNEPLKPEISWIIYDYFTNKNSKYKEDFKNYINSVKENNIMEEKRLNFLFPKDSTYKFFYSPYPRQMIRSNFSFIKNLIDEEGNNNEFR